MAARSAPCALAGRRAPAQDSDLKAITLNSYNSQVIGRMLIAPVALLPHGKVWFTIAVYR